MGERHFARGVGALCVPARWNQLPACETSHFHRGTTRCSCVPAVALCPQFTSSMVCSMFVKIANGNQAALDLQRQWFVSPMRHESCCCMIVRFTSVFLSLALSRLQCNAWLRLCASSHPEHPAGTPQHELWASRRPWGAGRAVLAARSLREGYNITTCLPCDKNCGGGVRMLCCTGLYWSGHVGSSRSYLMLRGSCSCEYCLTNNIQIVKHRVVVEQVSFRRQHIPTTARYNPVCHPHCEFIRFIQR